MNDAIITEASRYNKCYQNSAYKMCGSRRERANKDLPKGNGTALDISCGRGEWMRDLEDAGWTVKGTETVDVLLKPQRVIRAYLPEIPFSDSSFDFVSCLDVLEHLIPDQTELALQEIRRLSKGKWLIAVATVPDYDPKLGELHINLKTAEEWDALIKKHFEGYIISTRYAPMNIQYRIGY